jgi:hypothetical protein
MNIGAFQSIKGQAADETAFTQTLVNLLYGLAIEVNALKKELEEVKCSCEPVSEDSPTPK